MHMQSCNQTTLLVYMASTICSLSYLSCVITFYLKLGFEMAIKQVGLLIPTFQEKRTMMQMQNHAKNKWNWNGYLIETFLNFFSRFSFEPEVHLLASRVNAQLTVLPHITLMQRLCILVLFQYHRRIGPSIHFLLLL